MDPSFRLPPLRGSGRIRERSDGTVSRRNRVQTGDVRVTSTSQNAAPDLDAGYTYLGAGGALAEQRSTTRGSRDDAPSPRAAVA